MKSNSNLHGMGIIGAGGFAQFAATAFARVQGVELAGVTDIDLEGCFRSWAKHLE
jgi:predicted homoserine dehydrogenase-like protein